jgi:hypothetical protein
MFGVRIHADPDLKKGVCEPGGERGGEGVRSALFSGPTGLQAGGISH